MYEDQMLEIERLRNEIKELQRRLQLAESDGLGELHAGELSQSAQNDGQGVSQERGDLLTPHTSNLTPHTTHLTPHNSQLTHHTSHLAPQMTLSMPMLLRQRQSDSRMKSWLCLPTMSPLTSHHHTFLRRRHNRRLQLWR
jgi:hypothetical protein